ncbi:Hypothetical predicted protein [Pelobates cultripes]|uniref:Uncharacterized protein n=1 Tax=Pelobates cultripes TaxID=61616 RepID=A0AAD1S0Q7_PELCU|nr:Hypothetical predicted protein [Pelobates cultripes]
MADALDPAQQAMWQRQPTLSGTNDAVKDTIGDIFDRFWAKLLARLQPATTTRVPPAQDTACGERRPGTFLQGTLLTQDTDSSTNGPPGQRATGGAPHRCRPHRQRTVKQKPQRPTIKARRTIATGTTLGRKGTRARGKQVPALLHLRGRRVALPPRRHEAPQRASELMARCNCTSQNTGD